MENAEMQEVRTPESARDIGIITAEIKDLRRQANTMALIYAVEIGRRLVEAKSVLPYGQWGEWLNSEFDFSQSTANNFMRLFEEYGSAQISLFGACVDSQSFANLPYSKALQLLAVPEDEREAFAEEVGAADLSVKELKAAIEERDRAVKEAEEAKQREKELSERLAEAEEAAENSARKEAEAATLKKKLDDMTRELEKAKANADGLREKLKKAEADPKIPKAKLDQIKKEAEDAAKTAAGKESAASFEELKKRVATAEAEAASAKRDAERAKELLEAAEKKLKVSNPDVAAFKTLFDTIQETAANMKVIIETVRMVDAETADKLAAALKAFGQTL